MYRAGLKSILGFQVRGTTLVIDPCVPSGWRGFEIAFRYHSARYGITVDNPRGVISVEVDGEVPAEAKTRIPLVDDGSVHRVHVILG